MRRGFLILLLTTLAIPSAGASDASGTLTLGIQAYRPKALLAERFEPLGTYLEQKLGGPRLELRFLSLAELAAATRRSELDLVLSNPAHYLVTRSQNALSVALVTLVRQEGQTATASLGGVIATGADRGDIRGLADLEGKRIATPGQDHLGGYKAQAYEALQAGVNLPGTASLLEFGSHDAAIAALLDGTADAAFVRTGIIEAMTAEGALEPGALRVVNLQPLAGFPYLSSTRLYPEWPLVALPQVDEQTMRLLASALLALTPDHPVAQALGINGFAPAADYLPVEQLARALRSPPYDHPPEFTLRDVWERHRLALVAIAMAIALAATLVAVVLRRNRALTESEARFRSFFDHNSSVMLLVDPATGALRDANATAAAFYGYTQDQLRRLNVSDINTLPPDQVAEARRLAVHEQRNHFHFRHRLADAREREVEVYSTPIRSGGQEVLFSIIHDVTERKQAEASLVRERERLSNVLEGTRAGTWEWNVETGEVVLNERWAEIIGYRLEELAPVSIETWRRRTHPEDLERAEALLRRHFAGELPHYECELRMRHRNGDWVWVVDRGKAVSTTADGRPLWVAGTHTDITPRKRAEQELHRLTSQFITLLENATDFIYFKDEDSRFLFCSDALARATGHASWRDMIGKHDAEVFPPELANIYEEDEKPVFRHGANVIDRLNPYFAPDGEKRWVSTSKWPVFDDSGKQVVGVCGISRDVTEAKHKEDRLRLAASVFTHAREGILITDPEGTIVEVNAAFTAITGYTREEALGRNPRFLKSGRHDPELYAQMWHDLMHKGHWYGELWNRRKDGRSFAELLTISAIRDGSGAVRNYVALFSDITTQKEHQRQLEHIAHYDALTHLPNRVLLSDRLHQAMVQTLRRDKWLAVAYLDLDGFKEVNDSHGHEVGDQLLITLAGHMKRALREADTIARIGGDEFVAVLLDLDNTRAAIPLLRRLLSAAAQPLVVAGLELQVSASLGASFYPQDEEMDADQLLRQADQAMYQAKLAGKNRYHLFDAERDRSVRGHHESLDRIRLALERDEFLLHYQPQVNMHSGEVVGAEALLRWQHPERGLQAPGSFLPLIAGSPLEVELGDWVLRAALAQNARWRAEGLSLPVSVNVSALQLQQSDFTQRLRGLLADHEALEPRDLELEVLETSALEDMEQVSHIIMECRNMGIRFTLDDFGTGYSSLTYLRRLPAANLKIDRSFVHGMLDDPEDLAILEGVLGLATAFNRQAIAEGVESTAHGELLLKLGCQLAQGFAIARPMPAEELPEWRRRWRPPPSWPRQNPISRDLLPVLFAGVEHRSWVHTMEEFVHERRRTPPDLDPDRCRFGRWLGEGARESLRPYATMGAIDDLHHQAHHLGEEIRNLKVGGRTEEACRRLPELHRLRDALTARLEELAQEGPGARDHVPPSA